MEPELEPSHPPPPQIHRPPRSSFSIYAVADLVGPSHRQFCWIRPSSSPAACGRMDATVTARGRSEATRAAWVVGDGHLITPE
ncbi:hypothetical protein E2562_035271 [Oryza meyeriana var. granulata]|uniref:Uncharacterized protein n=1 Tax=Oryza meyeriana var. granulata TaxID=110450 RepID=A0A6G1F1T3_9ORYZ|nr:hypothetical protein E2562_035271 [Oryza meyeriana var. granulata]